MPNVVSHARHIFSRESWEPLAVVELVKISSRKTAFLLRSASHLQQVVLQSLGILQQRMQGETPSAIDVWDEVCTGTYRPKDENSLSDYVKRHLDQDISAHGIVSSREVEIRRKQGNAPGERTDIHITGVAPSSSGTGAEQWRVIVEVKGQWHPDLLKAMETQLRDRYLKDNDCSHGIYLVGWYRCPQWDANDRRNTQNGNSSHEDLNSKLVAQADGLSDENQRIDAFVLDASLR